MRRTIRIIARRILHLLSIKEKPFSKEDSSNNNNQMIMNLGSKKLLNLQNHALARTQRNPSEEEKIS